jgi:hypothetical protein
MVTGAFVIVTGLLSLKILWNIAVPYTIAVSICRSGELLPYIGIAMGRALPIVFGGG